MGCNCGGSSKAAGAPRERRRTTAPEQTQQRADVPARLRGGGGLFWTGQKRAEPKP